MDRRQFIAATGGAFTLCNLPPITHAPLVLESLAFKDDHIAWRLVGGAYGKISYGLDGEWVNAYQRQIFGGLFIEFPPGPICYTKTTLHVAP